MSFSQELQFWNQGRHASSDATTLLERSDVLWFQDITTSKLIFKNVNSSTQAQYKHFTLSPNNFIPHPHIDLPENIQHLQTYIKKEALDASDIDFIVFQILMFSRELERYDLSLSFPLLPLIVVAPNQTQLTQKFQLIPSFQTRQNTIDIVEACVKLTQTINTPPKETNVVLDWLEDPPPSLSIGIEILKNHIQNSWSLKYMELKKKFHLLQQYHNAQKNNKTSILSPQNIDIQASNRSIIYTDSSIKLLERDSQTTLVELCLTTFNNKAARRLRTELISILHCKIPENTKKQVQDLLDWLNKKIQNQRRQKILQTQLRQSQN